MARPKKIVETPGQEKAVPEENMLVAEGQLITAEQNGVQMVVTMDEPQPGEEAMLLAARNAILATINEQGAAIIARFESLGFSDLTDQSLTDNLDFLNLVRKATDVATDGTGPMVTNEEGKKQPAPGKPVLTEHGWHVPG